MRERGPLFVCTQSLAKVSKADRSADDVLFPDSTHRLISFVFRVPVQLPFGHQGTIGVELEGAGPPDWDHPVRVIPFEGAPGAPYVRNMRGMARRLHEVG